MAPAWLTAGKAALGTLVGIYIIGTIHFVDRACDNVEEYLPQEIVGQELALTHLTEALCQHMDKKQPQKPLVISVHGPPGVGKTYSHLWLARTLYNQHPSSDLDCPGIHCRGYKVIYGMDYIQHEAAAQLDAVRREVVTHLANVPDPLLVIEEYDKLDCGARGLWRQLLQHPERANITSHRAVILMESNLGMTELAELITQLGDRSKVTLAEAEQLLRDIVFEEWRKAGCESYTDTHKLVSLIDVFLPFFPLERQHMLPLVVLALKQRRQHLQRKQVFLTWQAAVADLLAGQVTYEGDFPLDGAKVVDAVMKWRVDRGLRAAVAKPGCKAAHGCSLQLSVGDGDSIRIRVTNNTAASALQWKQTQQREVQQARQQARKKQQQLVQRNDVIVEL